MADPSSTDQATEADTNDSADACSVTYEVVCSRLGDLSDRLSSQTRTLALSLIAFVWVVLAGESATAKKLCAFFGWEVIAIGFLAIVVLLLDIAHYAVGYRVSDTLRRKMEDNKNKKGRYDYNAWPYKAQVFCFWWKQYVLGIAAVWLLVRMAIYAFKSLSA